jgi:hypothetical protein
MCLHIAVDIETSYGLDGWGSIISRQQIILYTAGSRRVFGPPSLLYNWYQWLFPRGYSSPPCRAEIKNGGATPPLAHKSSWYSA